MCIRDSTKRRSPRRVLGLLCTIVRVLLDIHMASTHTAPLTQLSPTGTCPRSHLAAQNPWFCCCFLFALVGDFFSVQSSEVRSDDSPCSGATLASTSGRQKMQKHHMDSAHTKSIAIPSAT
eukprot:TRINITY_DN5023_c0_g1_i2.p1 TRINITY_DN5023_c0_g1~~TRINITY_DN5023_c0_g1_i2.p1  ORF type:complete len:121 (-),score=13.06 TRINITY_DN5023_c0_g1_i2:308-670(-)